MASGGGQYAQAAPPQPNPEIFVRRLYKPRLYDQITIGSSMIRQLTSLNRRMNQPGGLGNALASEVPQSDILLQSNLLLPEEFGKIYLGETFSAYVSIVNTLVAPIRILEAQASLKSSRSSEIILNNMAPTRSGSQVTMIGLGIGRDRPKELRPGENLDVVVEHVLQELDWHYLAIKLEFIDTRTGESRPMMKRFKFKVYNPVAITTMHRQLPNGEVLIQAQVKNITERHTSLMLEEVAFIAEDGLVSEILQPRPMMMKGAKEGDGGGDPCDCIQAFDRHIYLQPDDVVQYIYRLKRSETYKGRSMILSAGVQLGQLRVSWRTTLGEAGTLLSPRLICSTEAASAPKAVELKLEEAFSPDMQLIQGQVYTAKCTLCNNSDKDLWLQVQFHLEAMQGIYVTGKSFQNAGLVQAHTKRSMTFQFLPLMAGLHEVKGISVADLVTSQEFNQDRLGEFLVIKKHDDEVGIGPAGAGEDPLVPDLHNLSLT